jgi:hypothetical protein
MDTDFDLKHWDNVKDKLKDLFPQLTDSDLIWRHETKNDLYNMIATKLVITKREFSEIVESL